MLLKISNSVGENLWALLVTVVKMQFLMWCPESVN